MATRYSDVDLMLLKRWGDVKALREAFDGLRERITETMEGVLEKVSTAVQEKGFHSDHHVKWPSFAFWKPEWENRKKEPGVYFDILDFTPVECGKDVADHPTLWCMTDTFDQLRMRESGEDFGRTLRAAMSPELLARWDHEIDLSEYPLGRSYLGVSESDRVAMMMEPEKLTTFLLACVQDAGEVISFVDETLKKMTRR